MKTAILFNHFASATKLLDQDSNHFNTYSYLQAYNELASGDKLNRFQEFSEIKELQKQSKINNTVLIGVLLTEFDYINEAVIKDGSLTANRGKLEKLQNSEFSTFKTGQRLIAAPLTTKHYGLDVIYNFNESVFLNTSDQAILKIEIDFDDGNGFKKVAIGSKIAINYGDKGIKELKFKLTLASGEVKESSSSLEVKYNTSEYNSRVANGALVPFTAAITPDLSVYDGEPNYPGEGQYQIFLDTDNGVLDKPIILVDGFDPGDGRDILGMYDLLNYQEGGQTENLADYVRSLGYDVVILNFPVYTRAADLVEVDGGADFIERNAMLLVELLNIINSSKVGSEENVVIGPSMGGLISRYALNYMETNSIAHETRLWLSFDAPHHGANVPLGLQHLLNYMAFGLGSNNVVTLQPLIEGMLKSPAARQMLTDHLEAHLINDYDFDNTATEIFPKAHPWKAILDGRINGYPSGPRKISIINGSGDNQRYKDISNNDILPGFTVIDTNLDVALFTIADLEVHFTPTSAASTTGQLISSVDIKLLGVSIIGGTKTATAKAFSYTDGIDAGSGGLFDMAGLSDGIDTSGLVGDFLNALQTDVFNFIPSVSAMAMPITNNEVDWYHDINLGAPSSRGVQDSTPFDSWYIPTSNEPHVHLTEANVAFAKNEIVQETLSENDLEKIALRLERNPIQDRLIILNSTDHLDTQISITDITGKIVVNRHETLKNRTEIPVTLASGLYILTISTEQNTNKQFKLVVN